MVTQFDISSFLVSSSLPTVRSSLSSLERYTCIRDLGDNLGYTLDYNS